jgi:hypothetical protein
MLDTRTLYSKPYRPWEYSDLAKPDGDTFRTIELSAKEAYIKGVMDILQHMRHFPDAEPSALAKALLTRLIEL